MTTADCTIAVARSARRTFPAERRAEVEAVSTAAGRVLLSHTLAASHVRHDAPCCCRAYPFPHRAGGGACAVDGYCTDCGGVDLASVSEAWSEREGDIGHLVCTECGRTQ